MAERVIVLKVNGMHCQSCANAIGDALRSERGVKEARVEFGKKRAMIRFDSELVDDDVIRRAIIKAGYKVA